MMLIKRRYPIVITAFLHSVAIAQLPAVAPYYPIRSQGADMPRHLAGWMHHINREEKKKANGIFSVVAGYTRSFNSNDIAQCLFGTKNKCNALTISGSRVADRGANDLLADYFYLPNDFKSTLSFDPVVENIIVDFNWYMSFDNWYPGIYLYLYAPIVHSHWNLNMCERISSKGVNSHPAGYFTPLELERKQLLNSFTEYAQGLAPAATPQTVITTVGTGNDPLTATNTTAFLPLRYGKMCTGRLTRTRVPDIRGDFGFNFLLSESAHAGISLSFAAPTGLRPDGEYLFEPMIGNGHHWEIGGAFNAHHSWFCGEEDIIVSLYVDAHITHLLETKQNRTLDLFNGSLSRYMLAEQLDTPVESNLQGNGVTPSAVFKRQFAPVANLSRMTVDVKATLHAELTALLNIRSDGFSWDLGYNFWARTCEKLRIRGFNLIENNTKWALKGDAQVYGFSVGEIGVDPTRLAPNAPVPLSATQRLATIHGGTNLPATGAPNQATFDAGRTNPNIDNPQLATAGNVSQATLHIDPDTGASDQIRTSIQPAFLQLSDVNVCDGKTRGLSSKLFTHIDYTWYKHTCWVPHIGFGAFVEFNHGESSCTKNSCDRCLNCALSQWGLWLKGGIAFG